jgi:cyclopropane fatty-acyl-phospholipid synthase-like methyltransferase
MKRHAPAAERNRDAILDVLGRELPERGVVLEIASGTGQHAVHFAASLPGIEWQPSDVDPTALASIEAYRSEAALDNLRAPVELDAQHPKWPVERADAVVSINMVHISPWASAQGLFAGAARLLPEGAPLILYGPFRFDGQFTAPSNEAFDASLKSRDPRWGVRDVQDLDALGGQVGLSRQCVVDMPANNHVLVFRRA